MIIATMEDRREAKDAMRNHKGPWLAEIELKATEDLGPHATCYHRGQVCLYPELPWGTPPSWDHHRGFGSVFLNMWVRRVRV